MKIPFFRPSIFEDELNEVRQCLESGWLTTGPRTKQFETDFAQIVGAKHAIALNSCTAALHLSLEAIGLQAGDVVIVPTMTFAATAEVVRYFDATPVFVDCDQALCMDLESLEATVESILAQKSISGYSAPYGEIKAIIPMHCGGFCCDMEGIMSLAEETGIGVIEDCAHSFPSRYRKDDASEWKTAGKFGLTGCFSFYANKCITTGEGGMVVTDDAEIAKRINVMSLHGMNRDAWKRYTDQGSWYYEIVAPGFKYNMTDIAASIGIHQLKRYLEFREARKRVADRYNEAFHQHPAFEVPYDDESTRFHSWHLYYLRLNLERLRIARKEFIDELTGRGVGCSVHWLPLHLHPYYKKRYNFLAGVFPNAEREWPRLISLPIFPSMKDSEQEYVIEQVMDVAKRNMK